MFDFTKFICVILFASLMVAGCKDEEKEVVPKNKIGYDGAEYDLSQGLLRDYGQFNKEEGHTQILFLYSSGITVHESAGKIDSASGKGHIVSFEIFSAVPELLGDGEYTFDIYNTWKANTFDQAFAVINADYLTGDGSKHEVIAGKVTVKKDKEIYVIIFDCIDSDGKHITGFYKGLLKYYDEK